MKLTPEQVKGRIKNIAKVRHADARTLMRIYMMEHFLERIANSRYKDNFVIKGGMLVTAMVGVSLRSTMDIDTSITNLNLSLENARKVIDEIRDIQYAVDVQYEDVIKSIMLLFSKIIDSSSLFNPDYDG